MDRCAPLPKEISSWLICVLQRLPAATQWCTGRTRSKTLHGLAGYSSVAELDWEMIVSSTTLPVTIASISSLHSHSQSMAEDTAKQEWLRRFRAAQSKNPSQLYQCPSTSTIGPTPQLTSMDFFCPSTMPMASICKFRQTTNPPKSHQHHCPAPTNRSSNVVFG